jgi:hypothetical protein
VPSAVHGQVPLRRKHSHISGTGRTAPFRLPPLRSCGPGLDQSRLHDWKKTRCFLTAPLPPELRSQVPGPQRGGENSHEVRPMRRLPTLYGPGA